MNKVICEGFYVLRCENQQNEILWRIFSSWRQDDRWRISSGSSDLNRDISMNNNEHIEWTQNSGTVYVLSGDEKGSTFYTSCQLDMIMKKLNEAGEKCEIVTLDDVLSLRKIQMDLH